MLLQTAPSAACLDIALDAIRNPRSPFEQYHGLRAVDLMTHRLGKAQAEKLTEVLRQARGKYLTPANRSRWVVYEEIAAKLSQRQARRTGRGSKARPTVRAKGSKRRAT